MESTHIECPKQLFLPEHTTDIDKSIVDTNPSSDNVKIKIEKEDDPLRKRGNRIVDIDHFVKQFLDITNYGSPSCTSSELELHDEELNGLMSTFKFRCKKCKTFSIDNAVCDDNKNLNMCAVSGSIDIGGDKSQLDKFLAYLDLAKLTENVYRENTKLIKGYCENIPNAVGKENMILF